MRRSTNTRRADPAERLAAAHAQLVTAVQELTNGEEWRRMLAVAARFPTYSLNNVLLIGAQRPDATRVSGIRTWNSLGRRVRKGEKGIAILAPCLYRPRRDDPRHDQTGPRGPADRTRPDPGRPEPGRPEPDGTAPRQRVPREVRGFRVVHVFDVCQTVGEPLPEIAPRLLTGSAPALLTERLIKTIRGDGYHLERGPCGGANGYTDFTARTVRVRDDVTDAQAGKTLAHELGHIRADHHTRFLNGRPSSAGCRAQAEVEAESIAYLITHAAGLPADAYSVPYLAGWSGGNTDLVREAATRVIAVTRGVLEDLRLELPADLAPAPVIEPHRPAGPAALPPEIDREPPEVGR
ncbi:ArdC-like ssDNA-binding domain-containing protein [Sporichthya polymorpha]|uniref:ArdC-like ssDNA-binding domain-containing protein n=1 Tax=Sporichthya polymorpha TaxID=35751 RepID=UPI000360144D|nr:ArdC-like ssDNA-binding domain-containing protein [Sporichthya polymorpha]